MLYIYTISGDCSLFVVCAENEDEAWKEASISSYERSRYRIDREEIKKGFIASYIE
jgi:hypothetical protein